MVICLASCRALILKGALKNDDDAVNLFGGETVIVDDKLRAEVSLTFTL